MRTPDNPPLIELKAQSPLSFKRLWVLTLTGLKQRLYRSLITIMVVTVSTAFLVQFVLTSIFGLRVEAQAQGELMEHRFSSAVASYLERPLDEESITQLLVDTPYPEIREDLKRLSGLSGETFGEAVSTAKRLLGLDAFGKSLTVVEKRDLGWIRGYAEFLDRAVRETSFLDNFYTKLNPSLERRLPGGVDGLRNLVKGWESYKSFIAATRDAHGALTRMVNEETGGDSIVTFLSQGPDLVAPLLEEAGFSISKERLETLTAQASQLALMTSLERRLNRTLERRALAGIFNSAPEALESYRTWKNLQDPSFVEELNKRLIALDPTHQRFDAKVVSEVAGFVVGVKRAEEAIVTVSQSGLGAAHPVRVAIYFSVSLLVCLVGVSNALLMSVSERSKEIATMKCIGALDGTILKMIFIEAGIIGIIGGAMGAITGLFFALLPGFLRFGGYLLSNIGLGAFGSAFFLAVSAGLLISATACVYPALRASRLAPMEAMRIE